MPMRFTMPYILKITTRLFVIVLALLLLPYSGFAQNVDDSLDIGMISIRTTQLLPLTPQERDFVSIYNLIYESLINIDDNGMPVPYLAKEYKMSNGGKNIKFFLRDNVKFSDGRPLTANDVAACGNYILNIANGEGDKGYYRNMAYNIKEFKVEDDYTLNVVCQRPYFATLYSLKFPVVPADMVQSPNPPTTGPYIVQDFKASQELWLQSNDNWWQQKPQVKSIMIRFYQNNKDLISDYEFGRIDSAVTRSIAAAQYKSGLNSLSVTYSTNQLETLMLNNQSYPLNNPKIRNAISKGIDIATISNRVYMGMANRAYSPFKSGSWLYEDIEGFFRYDLEGAKQILQEEGWADTDDDGILDILNEKGEKKNLRLRLMVYEDPENDLRYETANKIEEMLNKLKIYVKIETATMAKMLPILEAGSYDMALVSFQLDNAIDPGFLLMSSNIKYGNYSRYRSKEMDELFASYRNKENPSEFAFAAKYIQVKFAEDIPFIPLFYRTGSILTRKIFTNARDIREMEIFRGIESFTSLNKE